MSLLDDILKAFRRTTPKALPSSSALAMQERGRVAKANVQLFRYWAEHSEWIRAAINIRKSQVSSAEWDIVPFDPEKNYSPVLAQKIKNLFDRPNPSTDSFRSFLEPIIEDVMVLDAGVVEKVRTLRGEPVQLWAVDGGAIRVSTLWDGSNPNEPRYFWYPDGQLRAQFTNDDVIYLMANPSTYRPVGLSPLETLKLTIDSELSGHTYNHRQVINAAPDGMLDLGEGARPEQVEEFKSYWSSEVAGKGAMAFIGGSKNAKFIPFRSTNREMQFLEWQIYLVRKICAVFGLSPQDLGLTFDVNRSSGEVQQENTEDRGIRPVLSLLQDYFTREIVWDEAFGGIDNNLAFRFTHLNLRETLSQAKVMEIQLAGLPWRSVNEVRKEQGLEPWSDEFNMPMIVTPTGAVRLDKVPTAREVMENDKKPPAGPNGTPAEGKATAASGSKGN
jgi:HK97 family phage portal protein